MNPKNKIKILEMQISEPWDFETPSGDNKFKVKFIKFMTGEYGKYLLLKTIKPFSWKEKRIDYLILQERYEGDSIDDIFNKSKKVIIGIYRLINNEHIETEVFPASAVEYFAIGSVSLIKGKR